MVTAIIDYGSGNLRSVENALRYLGEETVIVDDPKGISKASRLILPGVGSFGFMMRRLRKNGLEKPIKDAILQGTPILGICLGFQALFEESEESPGVKGLGIFQGKVVRFKNGKVPQIGWNRVTPTKNSKSGQGIFEDGYAYFVNSYYILPDEKCITAAKTEYLIEFISAIQWKNVTAVQFHPEKSGDFGLNILRRWLQCSRKG